jgi:[Skp1-protein]-hydroxyproline N-acetylglucosaminyltransferase
MLLWGLLVLLCFLLYYKWYSKQEEILGKKIYVDPYNGPVRDDDSIFVSIASYRDPDCTNTLHDLFHKASFPARVFVGLVEQNKKQDQNCFDSFSFSKNVRQIRLHYNQARGPCYARYLASCLYRGETFFFQIDSHTKFEYGWDARLIHMLKDMPSNAIISNYPISWTDRDNSSVPRFSTTRRHGSYYVFNSGFSDMKTKHEKHFATSGGMLFMRGHTLLQVPYDAELDWVFEGEEFLYSARLFTYGYDFYRPTQNVVSHFYDRKDRPKFWTDLHRFRNQVDPVQTVHERMKKPPFRYFGNTRSLQEYIQLLEKHLKQS